MANTVIKKFKDKDTKEVYKIGGSYTHSDEKRISFLVEKGYLDGKKADKKTDKK